MPEGSSRLQTKETHGIRRAGLRWGDLDLAALESGPDPFEKLAFCAPDRHGGAIEAGQWADAASLLQATAEPVAPIGQQGQTVEVSDGSQNQIG